MTPETQRKLLIAGGILGVLVVVAVIGTWLSRSTGDIPVILPDERPIRVKPDDPGGMKVAGIDNGLYGESDTQGAARLAAAPEAPDPLALRAPPEPQAQPAKDAATAMPAQDAERPRTVAIAPPLAARPQTPAAAPRTTGPQASAPSAPPTQPVRTPAQEAPRPVTAAPPPAAPAAAASRPDSKPASGRVSVQLAAVQSEGAAQAEWQALRLRHPELFGARSSAISKTERDGKTFWRVRTPGFADLAEARAFCERVRAKGAGCAVAEF